MRSRRLIEGMLLNYLCPRPDDTESIARLLIDPVDLSGLLTITETLTGMNVRFETLSVLSQYLRVPHLLREAHTSF